MRTPAIKWVIVVLSLSMIEPVYGWKSNICWYDAGHAGSPPWFNPVLSGVIVPVWITSATSCFDSTLGYSIPSSLESATGLTSADLEQGVERALHVWNEESGSSIHLRYMGTLNACPGDAAANGVIIWGRSEDSSGTHVCEPKQSVGVPHLDGAGNWTGGDIVFNKYATAYPCPTPDSWTTAPVLGGSTLAFVATTVHEFGHAAYDIGDILGPPGTNCGNEGQLSTMSYTSNPTQTLANWDLEIAQRRYGPRASFSRIYKTRMSSATTWYAAANVRGDSYPNFRRALFSLGSMTQRVPLRVLGWVYSNLSGSPDGRGIWSGGTGQADVSQYAPAGAGLIDWYGLTGYDVTLGRQAATASKWQSPTTLVTRDISSGWYTPASTAEWTTLLDGTGVPPPSQLWSMQETSGNLADSIGTATLVPTGTVSYHQSVPGWARKAVAPAPNGTNYFFRFADPNLGNPGNGPTTLLALVAVNATPTADRMILLAGDGNGLKANVTSSKEPKLVISNGTATATGTSPVGTTVRPWIVRGDGGVSPTFNKLDDDLETVAPSPTRSTSAWGAVFFGGAVEPAATSSYLYAASWNTTAMTDAQASAVVGRLENGPPAPGPVDLLVYEKLTNDSCLSPPCDIYTSAQGGICYRLSTDNGGTWGTEICPGPSCVGGIHDGQSCTVGGLTCTGGACVATTTPTYGLTATWEPFQNLFLIAYTDSNFQMNVLTVDLPGNLKHVTKTNISSPHAPGIACAIGVSGEECVLAYQTADSNSWLGWTKFTLTSSGKLVIGVSLSQPWYLYGGPSIAWDADANVYRLTYVSGGNAIYSFQMPTFTGTSWTGTGDVFNDPTHHVSNAVISTRTTSSTKTQPYAWFIKYW